MAIDKTLKFIEKVINKYGNLYDCSETKVINSRQKVKVDCTVHGEFEQTTRDVLSKGCPSCTYYGDKTQHEYYLAKAIEVHEGKYNYTNTTFTKAFDKVTILCEEHGEFTQAVSAHTSGKGCIKCGITKSSGSKRSTHEVFIKRVTERHKGKYTYEDTLYERADSKVTINCPIHGDFQQVAAKHLSGEGCRFCVYNEKKHTTEDFIKLANKIHENKYDYTPTKYIDNKAEVSIVCPKHGEFSQRATSHLEGKGCRKCGGAITKCEDQIHEHFTTLGLKVEQGNRTLIKPLELDLVIHDKKIAIEYNGIRWHSEKFRKDKNYHKNKTELCKEQGYRLIHIWEDDYLKDPQKELDFLAYTLGCTPSEKVYARKTKIKEIPSKIGREFLDRHHIQGSGTGSIYYGMFLEDTMVAVTSFLVTKTRVELTRHVSDRQVVGGLGKVTKYASRSLQRDILSFCDLSRFDGKSYLACGYETVEEIAPDYKYVVRSERQHKFNWRKDRIKVKLPEVYDPQLTERQMMELADIPRIWDCGKLKLIYKYIAKG